MSLNFNLKNKFEEILNDLNVLDLNKWPGNIKYGDYSAMGD